MKLFKNGIIVDGSGQKPYPGDILVKDDRIIRIDTTIEEPAAQVINLDWNWITPGFIDSHSHNDWFCLREDKALFFDSFLRQGVTTMITGNCGFSATGCLEDSKYIDEHGGKLFFLADNQRYPRCHDWLEAIDQQIGVNIATLMGHGTARTAVAGLQQVELSKEQEDKMLQILEQGLQEGATGISLGLMYAPGLFAPMSELEKVAALVAKYDRILTIHPRAESAVSLSYSMLGKSHLLRALDEIVELTKRTGCRTVYSHLIFVGRRSWKDIHPALKTLEKLKADGFYIGFDMYPFDFGASVITVILPDWYMKLDLEERKKPGVLVKLKVMIAATTKLLGFGFADIRVAYAGEKNARFNGMTIVEIAEEINQTPFETYLKICEESDFKARVLMGSYQNDEIIERLMNHPLSVYMSDAWYEQDGVQNDAIYESFPKFLQLGRKHEMPIEQVIHKMSGQTAARYQLQGRGEIKPGNFADLVVIQPEDLSIQQVYVNGHLVVNQDVVQQDAHRQGQAISLAQED